MRLLTRYLAKEIYSSVALVFAALIMLFSFMDLIQELGEMGAANYHIGYVLLYVALIIPGHIYELFPLAALIGTIFAIVQMASNSELMVYRSSGVSLKQMIFAVVEIGLPLVVLCFVFGEFIAPPSDRLAQELNLKARDAQMALKEFRSGVWAKDEHSFVNIRNVLPDTSLLNISIYEFDEAYHLRVITSAQRAEYIKGDQWMLEGVLQTRFNAQGSAVNNQARMEWHSTLNPRLLDVLLLLPEKMSSWDLYQYTKHLSDNHQKTARYEIAMWNKLAYPAAVLIMMLLALPFAAHHRREGGVSGKIFIGIVLGLSFHFGGKLFSSLGALNDWQPVLSATAISWMYLSVALLMMWQTERR
ncbi:MAG: LPS export ABC transporter permease LptG [Gallionellaceae bacterium]|nr:MAG: LPS export ABC transporter permease LptG [Gallionellaceae bacterium]